MTSEIAVLSGSTLEVLLRSHLEIATMTMIMKTTPNTAFFPGFFLPHRGQVSASHEQLFPQFGHFIMIGLLVIFFTVIGELT